MNWDEELEEVQWKMDEREWLWRNAMAAGAMGSAYAETWFNSLTPEQQEMLREMIEEVGRRTQAFFDDFRVSLEELARNLGEQLMPAIQAFGVAADEMRRRECDVNRPRLYWDGERVERGGRYRPYRSRRSR